jgi:hypothetical protein
VVLLLVHAEVTVEQAEAVEAEAVVSKPTTTLTLLAVTVERVLLEYIINLSKEVI